MPKNPNTEIIVMSLATLQEVCHEASKARGWWHRRDGKHLLSDPEYAPYVIATKIALIHSEVSEGLKGDRRDKMDDKLPHRSMLEVELADALIRVLDLAGQLKLDVAGAVMEKLDFNDVRPDHDLTERYKPGGKKY